MYKVGIIGLGHIAAMYGSPEEQAPYCHVGGISHSDKARLAATADPSEVARETFRLKWGSSFPDLKYYTSTADMLGSENLDIVSVCVRGPYHYQVMMEVLEHQPRAVFLEKPATCSLTEMDEIVSKASASNIPITVSYSRHWTPHVLRLQELVREGIIGDVTTVVGYTGNEILSYASHTTDLICQFAGYCPTAVYATGKVDQEAPQGYEAEPHLSSMLIEFENGVTGIQVGTSGQHGPFYCDVYGTKGMIRVGMYIPPFGIMGDGEVIDFNALQMPKNESVFTVAYNQICDYLDGGKVPPCTNQEFVVVHEIGFAAIESIYRQMRITLPNQYRSRKVFANG